MSALLASIVVVTNIGFMAGYDTVTRNPAWVAYDLEPSEVVAAPRAAIGFKPDPRIPETADVRQFYDIMGQHFDRGHLAPAADFNWATNALRETYNFSNIAPMRPNLNRGAWSRAEREVRQLAARGTAHVVIFPTYEKLKTHVQYNTTGCDIVVPSGFVKVAWGWFGVRFWNLENK